MASGLYSEKAMLVPRVFHFVFGLKEQTQPFSLLHYLTLRSCLQVNQPQAIRMHYRHEPWGPLWGRVRDQIELCRIDRPLPLSDHSYPSGSASAAFRYAHSSDFLRLDILLREGGVYADMDTLFVRPYPDELFQHSFVMGRETADPHVKYAHGGGSLCNALFFAARGAEFAGLWRREMEAAFDGSWSRHSTFLPYELSLRNPGLIHVEPTTSFFHLDWTREGVRDLFERSVELPTSVYSLHLWAHLWADRARTDVTRFHEGRLTPAYVRYADTTFARYARPWLPDDLEAENAFAWITERLTQGCADVAAEWSEGLRTVARRTLGFAAGRRRAR